MSALPNPKEATRRIIDGLDDAASFEEIQYQLYVVQKIEAGLRDVEAGRTVPHAEVRRRLGRWLDGPAPEDG